VLRRVLMLAPPKQHSRWSTPNTLARSIVGERIVHLTHSSEAGLVLAIVGNWELDHGVSGGAQIYVYEDQFLNRQSMIPSATLGKGIYECHFVFFDSKGTGAWAMCGTASGPLRVVRVTP
jgi:hypothetical protein